MKAVAGIDGGGAGSRLCLLTLQGEPLATGQAGPANYRDTGLDGLAATLDACFRDAISQLPERPVIAAAHLGLAGAGQPGDAQRIRQRLESLPWLPQGYFGLSHDLLIAAHAAFDDQPGLILVAGTGSACYGRDDDGRELQLGGWGPLFGDEGSGYWLGAHALSLAAKMTDGRLSPTPLLRGLLERLDAPDLRHALERHRQGRLPRAAVADLALPLLEHAGKGDRPSLALLEHGAAELAELVKAALDQANFAAPKLALFGGLLAAASPYRRLVEQAIGQRCPIIAQTEPQRDPAQAAARLALQSLRR